MKKYIKPAIAEIKIQAPTILSGSDLSTEGTTEQNLSRQGRNTWDDEEEY